MDLIIDYKKLTKDKVVNLQVKNVKTSTSQNGRFFLFFEYGIAY